MFTEDECKLLFEALDALELKGSSDALMVSVFSTILAPPDKRDEVKREREKEFARVEEESGPLKERIILLKAKMITLRDHSMINELEFE